MTDAHCHVPSDGPIRELLIGRDFVGVHPWCAEAAGRGALDEVRARIASEASLGVGEIGLDRLHAREIPPRMREVFEQQLEIAAEAGRPVVLHGAKCWGQVVEACSRHATRIPAFLFHGFSRSDGLLPDIIALNGYISVGPAVLNDHATNYRELVKKIPLDRLLVETDRTPENAGACADIFAVAAKTAELRGLSTEEMELAVDANADRFFRR